VKYLQSSKCCPQCGLKIHETQPLLNLKSDRVMQDIVFKLVPGLYESEYSNHHLLIFHSTDMRIFGDL